MGGPTVMLVAAEASGDALGAGLARALRARLPGVRFVGVGGAGMAGEGIESPFDIAQLSIVGVFEGVLAYPRVLRLADETVKLARRERPDIAVLIDSWGFTLRVAHRLRRALPDMPIVKYVGPQIWATRPGRARTLAKAVDHLLTIHSFDAPMFEAAGLATTFVGNPVLARDFSGADPATLREAIGASPDEPLLLVLPGSRPGEIERIAPAFDEAVDILLTERPDLKVVVPAAETVVDLVKARVAGWRRRVPVVEGEPARLSSMKAATVALACSGTVTTELALAGCPMVIAYRLGPMTAIIARMLIRTKWITLFNIAAQEAVAPELIQDDCNGPALAREIGLRLDDPALRERQIAAQNAALDKMGRDVGDPSDRAAEAVLAVLRARRRLPDGPMAA
jgi:lipid-A-disaccharide synthase